MIRKISTFFLVIILAFGFFACKNETEKTPQEDIYAPKGEILLKFGVISDGHAVKNGAGHLANTSKHISNALTYFSDKADAIMMTGDMVENGLQSSYNELSSIMDKALDGSKAEILYAPGNHEFYDEPSHDRPETRQRFIDFAGSMNKHVEIKGYHFITIGVETTGGKISAESIKYLKDELKSASEKSQGKPIFIGSHQPIINTVYGSKSVSSPDSSLLMSAIRPYSNAVLFTGHSHVSSTDERNIYQSSFSMLNVGALSYVTALNNNVNDKRFDNILDNSRPDDVNYNNVAVGYEVDVYQNVTIINKIDFNKGEKYGEPFLIESSGKTDAFLYTKEKRKAKDKNPIFENEDLSATKGESVKISFSKATAPLGIDSYEITISYLGYEDVIKEVVYMPDTYFPKEEKDFYEIEVTGLDSKRQYSISLKAISILGKESIVQIIEI